MDARTCVNTGLNTNRKLGTPWRASETLYSVLGPPLQKDCWETGKRASKELPRQSKVSVFAVAPFWASLDYSGKWLWKQLSFSQASTLPDSRAMPQKRAFSLYPSSTLRLVKWEATCDEFLQEHLRNKGHEGENWYVKAEMQCFLGIMGKRKQLLDILAWMTHPHYSVLGGWDAESSNICMLTSSA